MKILMSILLEYFIYFIQTIKKYLIKHRKEFLWKKYSVSGLINEDKKTQVKNALNKIDGVNMVNVDLGRGSIEVGYNSKVDPNAITNCIEHVGCQIQ